MDKSVNSAAKMGSAHINKLEGLKMIRLVIVSITLLLTSCVAHNPYMWAKGKESAILTHINQEIDEFVASCEKDYSKEKGFIQLKENLEVHKPIDLKVSVNGMKIKLIYSSGREEILKQDDFLTYVKGIGFTFGESSGMQAAIKIRQEDF